MSVWLVGSSCQESPAMSKNLKKCETIGESDNPSPFNFTTGVLKVPRSVERPMQTSDNPVRKTADVDRNVLVNLGTPGRNKLAIFIEAIDRLLAELANEVDSTLDVETLFVHDNRYHIVSISF
jgi:hypothetical protein